jgi:hypothetical protein
MSPAFVDKLGLVMLYGAGALLILRIAVPESTQENLRKRFDGPLSWFHKHVI